MQLEKSVYNRGRRRERTKLGRLGREDEEDEEETYRGINEGRKGGSSWPAGGDDSIFFSLSPPPPLHAKPFEKEEPRGAKGTEGVSNVACGLVPFFTVLFLPSSCPLWDPLPLVLCNPSSVFWSSPPPPPASCPFFHHVFIPLGVEQLVPGLGGACMIYRAVETFNTLFDRLSGSAPRDSYWEGRRAFVSRHAFLWIYHFGVYAAVSWPRVFSGYYSRYLFLREPKLERTHSISIGLGSPRR